MKIELNPRISSGLVGFRALFGSFLAKEHKFVCMTPAKDTKQWFLIASQLTGDRGRPAGRPGDRLEQKS